MYLSRHIESPPSEAVAQFPAVALSGPRQTGKATLLKQLFAERFDYVTLDDMALRNQARKDPQAFLRNYPDALPMFTASPPACSQRAGSGLVERTSGRRSWHGVVTDDPAVFGAFAVLLSFSGGETLMNVAL